MDLANLAAVAGTAWRRRASLGDFLRCVLWTYAGRLPAAVVPSQWIIGFFYPPPIGAVRLCLRSNDGADAFTHSEVFAHRYYQLPLRSAPATILDLGANIGLSAVYFARLFPNSRLACVEPVADNLRLLVRNLKLNGIKAEVIAAAVDAKDGVVVMERGARDYGHKVAEPASSPASLFEVTGISVPSIMRRMGWSRIGLVKMDIEGHEKALFAHACEWLHDVDTLCMEYHHHFAERDLAGLAARFGFRAPRRLPGHVWFLTREESDGRPANA